MKSKLGEVSNKGPIHGLGGESWKAKMLMTTPRATIVIDPVLRDFGSRAPC